MFPYERVVQWATGPVAAGIGLLATDVMHQNISKSSSVAVAAFALSSAATYLAHHKWMDNLAKWWNKQDPALREEATQVGKDVGPDLEADVTRIFNEITAQHAAAEKVQNQAGTENPQVGLSPSPEPSSQPVPQPGINPQG